jgi:hypothetical protein
VKTSRKEIDMVKLSDLAGRNAGGKTVRTAGRKCRQQNRQNFEEGNTGGKTVRSVRKEIQVGRLSEL